MNWSEKRSQLIRKLPTLLDILERISLEEEIFLLKRMRLQFPTHYQEGMFFDEMMMDGTTQLWPISLRPYVYYRGESEYHPVCKPSLYRPYMTPAKRFVERLKCCELSLLMSGHPMTKIFHNGVSMDSPTGGRIPLKLSVDYLALAQHYGICTELLDLTVSKWVAAFFACTKCKDDVYTPIKDTDSYGVFYELYVDDRDVPSDMEPSSRRLRAVGLQPFTRPGEQAGYVYKMTPRENFNKLCQRKTKFRHDPNVSELVFNYANRSKKLFPYDLLQDKAKIIKESKVFSNLALTMALTFSFPKQPKDIYVSWTKEEGIQIQPNPIVSFTDQECEDFLREWPSKEKAFYNRILPRIVYSGKGKEYMDYFESGDPKNLVSSFCYISGNTQ